MKQPANGICMLAPLNGNNQLCLSSAQWLALSMA